MPTPNKLWSAVGTIHLSLRGLSWIFFFSPPHRKVRLEGSCLVPSLRLFFGATSLHLPSFFFFFESHLFWTAVLLICLPWVDRMHNLTRRVRRLYLNTHEEAGRKRKESPAGRYNRSFKATNVKFSSQSCLFFKAKCLFFVLGKQQADAVLLSFRLVQTADSAGNYLYTNGHIEITARFQVRT